MQLAQIAGGISPVVVENTVCYIARLLNFNQEIALPYGMDTTGGKKEHIAGLSEIFTESIHDSRVLYLALYALWCFLRRETVVEVCAVLWGDTVPHLGLTALAFKAGTHFVVRMNLDGKIPFGVDELYQQRKLTAYSRISRSPMISLPKSFSNELSVRPL